MNAFVIHLLICLVVVDTAQSADDCASSGTVMSCGTLMTGGSVPGGPDIQILKIVRLIGRGRLGIEDTPALKIVEIDFCIECDICQTFPPGLIIYLQGNLMCEETTTTESGDETSLPTTTGSADETSLPTTSTDRYPDSSTTRLNIVSQPTPTHPSHHPEPLETTSVYEINTEFATDDLLPVTISWMSKVTQNNSTNTTNTLHDNTSPMTSSYSSTNMTNNGADGSSYIQTEGSTLSLEHYSKNAFSKETKYVLISVVSTTGGSVCLLLILYIVRQRIMKYHNTGFSPLSSNEADSLESFECETVV